MTARRRAGLRGRLALSSWALAAALAACSQEAAPSDELEDAANTVVVAVEGADNGDAAGPYAPRDDCSSLPGSAAFLATLDRAIARRDADALVTLAADDIVLDTPDQGAAGGTAMLRRRLAETDGALWRELSRIGAMGCAVDAAGGLTRPWFAAQVGADESPALAIITGTKVPFLDQPRADGPVIARLSWEAVELVPEDAQTSEYFRVRLADDDADALDEVPPRIGGEPAEGYVAAKDLRLAKALSLSATSRNGRWRIVRIAGLQ